MNARYEEEEEDFTCISVFVAHILLLYNACITVSRGANLVIQELQENSIGDYSVNKLMPKLRRLDQLVQGHASLFKSNTGFYPSEFEGLCQKIGPVIASRSRHTNSPRLAAGRSPKLTTQDRVLACVMYLRGCSGVRIEAATWNYSRMSLRDDAMFVCGVINEVLLSEIRWPDADIRAESRNRIPIFPGCIGFVDGTLCKIRRPRSTNHSAYFNGRKNMYCLNSTVIIDHDGLFMYIEPGYAGSYHDVTVLRDTELARNWQTYFALDTNHPHPVEYLLGDPGYLGMDHFILKRIDAREASGVDSDPVLRAFKKLHAGYRVQVEWGIGGLKQRFRRFLEVCPNRRNVFTHMFTTAAILTNFLHRRRKDFSIVLSQDDAQTGEWAS